MEAVEFTYKTNTPIIVDPQTHPFGETYFLFRSSIDGFAIDKRAPYHSMLVKFAFRLPQSLVSSIPGTDIPSVVKDGITPTTSTQADTDVEVLAYEVGNYKVSYDVELEIVKCTQLRWYLVRIAIEAWTPKVLDSQRM